MIPCNARARASSDARAFCCTPLTVTWRFVQHDLAEIAHVDWFAACRTSVKVSALVRDITAGSLAFDRRADCEIPCHNHSHIQIF
jgi:hypothetical protein